MASLLWPHKVRITVPAPEGEGPPQGAHHAEDDTWVAEAPEGRVVLYEGGANVNDGGRISLGRLLTAGKDGALTVKSDAVCYLKRKGAASGISTGALVHITWQDKTTSDAVVTGVVRADNSLNLSSV